MEGETTEVAGKAGSVQEDLQVREERRMGVGEGGREGGRARRLRLRLREEGGKRRREKGRGRACVEGEKEKRRRRERGGRG